MNDDFRPIRVGAIPNRHRGGLLDSWAAYAEWLEQLVAHGDDTYDTLPRERRRPAIRLALREARVRTRRPPIFDKE